MGPPRLARALGPPRQHGTPTPLRSARALFADDIFAVPTSVERENYVAAGATM